MKLKITSFLFFLLFHLFLSAQQMTVTGTVTLQSTGEALPGVSVSISKSSHGTITDLDGKFSISVSKGDELSFSFIGLKTRMVEVSSTVLDIQLVTSDLELTEVVAVGYGSMKKSDLTGALSSLNMSDTKNANNSDMNQLLQGRLAGVQATTNNGMPGAAMSINIRGIGSMSSSSQPLYVIDGVVMDNSSLDLGAIQSNGLDVSTLNPMRNISTEDISNVEVLKDASATAIYGSRGANGVILITTKKAEKGKTQSHFEASTGITQLMRKMDVLDGPTFGRYANEKGVLSNLKTLPYPVDVNGNFITPLITKDWQKDYTQLANQLKLRADASASFGKSDFLLALGYTSNEGVVPGTGSKKYDFRLNSNLELNNWFSVNSVVSVSHNSDNLTTGTAYSATQSMLTSLYQTRPVLNGIQDASGGIDVSLYAAPTPREWITNHQDQTEATSLFAKLEAKLKLSNALNFSSRGGYSINASERRIYFGQALYQGKATNGKADRILSDNNNLSWDNMFNYFKKFNSQHRLDGTAGITLNYMGNSYQDYQATYFMDDKMLGNAMQSGAASLNAADNFTSTTYLSGLFRLNYVFKEKLFFTATGRADRVSKFAPGNQWGYFPSFAAAYNLQQESWVKNSIPAISQLKLRLGWGQVGNSSSPSYATMNQYAYVPTVSPTGALITALTATSKGNPSLTWETSQQVNAGYNLGLWDNRLRMNFDVYYKETTNQLQRISLPPSSGFAYTWVNAGNVSNKGIELELNGDLIQSKDWSATLGGNISVNRNKIIKIGRAPDSNGDVKYLSDNIGANQELAAPGNVFMEGQPIGMFWGYKTNGIVQTADVATAPTFFGTASKAGDIRFLNTRGTTNNIDQNDQTIIGNPNPDFIFGFNGNLGYRSFKFSFLVNGSVGNQILNATAATMSNVSQGGAWSNVLAKAYTEAWRTDYPSTTYPRLASNNAMFNGIITDRMVEDGSFVKLSAVTFSYDYKPKKLFFNKLTIFINATNLFYLTKYSGFSPELPSWRYGIALNEFPDAKVYSAGFNFAF